MANDNRVGLMWLQSPLFTAGRRTRL